MSTSNIQSNGVEQCRQFLQGLSPKTGSREIWIKSGHDLLYRAAWDEQGNLSGTATALTDKNNPQSRVDRGKPIADLLKHLAARSLREDGGVFYIPTQPQGLPLASCVDATDDIGIEIDHLSLDDQRSLVAKFAEITGLEFASVLTSGGASVHCHLKTDQHYPVADMHYWRRLVVIAFQSDPVTVRLHQPMRLPGFYRKEKEALQELLGLSDRRYTFSELAIGFAKWFEYKSWALPTEIPDQWWSEAWQPLFSSTNPAAPSLKAIKTHEYLHEGSDTYIARRLLESQQAQSQRSKIEVSGEKISDRVQQVCDRAGTGDFPNVDWQGGSGHYRGQCPFHAGKSKSSAWLSDKNGGFKFHCSSCTNDLPRDAFEYWTALQNLTDIGSDRKPEGKDYVKAAELFLAQYGVSLPKTPLKPSQKPAKVDNTEPLHVEFNRVAQSAITQKTYQQINEEIAIKQVEINQARQKLKENKNHEDDNKLKQDLRWLKEDLENLKSDRHDARSRARIQRIEVDEDKRTKFSIDAENCRKYLEGRLTFNTLKAHIEFDGQTVLFDNTRAEIGRLTGFYEWNCSDDAVYRIALDMAKQKSYCPIQEYLLSVEENFGDEVSHEYLEEAATRLFGVQSDVQKHYFKATMIGAVKRAFEPGCKHDYMLILYSKDQGKKKSTIIPALFGNDFSGEGTLSMGDKDSYMVLAKSWVHEIAECDTVFSVREASQMKDFITHKQDIYRAPYDRHTKEHPRRTILIGTTNQKEILTDETGNRRFAILNIPEGFVCDVDYAIRNRDKIMAAALDGYRSGVPNIIPESLFQSAKDEEDQWLAKDPWAEIIKEWMHSNAQKKVEDVLIECLKYEPSRLTRRERVRCAKVLRAIGCTCERETTGERKEVYSLPAIAPKPIIIPKPEEILEEPDDQDAPVVERDFIF